MLAVVAELLAGVKAIASCCEVLAIIGVANEEPPISKIFVFVSVPAKTLGAIAEKLRVIRPTMASQIFEFLNNFFTVFSPFIFDIFNFLLYESYITITIIHCKQFLR